MIDVNSFAISYLRFSSSKQKKGSSYERQLEATKKYCAKNNLTLIDQIEDKGISGWNEDNLEETAALGKLLKLIDLGKIKKGTTLIVENLDRITRANLNKAVNLVTGILEKGIDIVTTMDGKRYQKNCDPTDLMIAIIFLTRGNDESETKSKRVKEAWVKKRHLIESGVPVKLTQHPNWLKFENNKYVEIPEAAAIVKRIFEMYVNGRGGHVIAKTLNSERVKPFSKTGGSFTFSSIERLLKNSSVIGHCEIVSPAKENYYPAIISEETWYKAQAIRKNNNHYKGTRNDSKRINILGGIIKCRACNCNLVRYSCTGKNQKRYHYLTCSKAKYGEHKLDLYPYNNIENLFVIGLQSNGFLNSFLKQFSSPKTDDRTDEIEGKIIVKQNQIERMADAIEQSDSDELVKRLRRLEIEKKELKEALKLEKERLSIIKSEANSVDAFSKLIKDEIESTDFRIKLRTFLRSSIKHVLVNREDEFDTNIEIIFKETDQTISIYIEKVSGSTFNYYIRHQQNLLFAVDQQNETDINFLKNQAHKNTLILPAESSN